MSSDPFGDLAASLGDFASALRGLLDEWKRPALGSPADAESSGEPHADEWGDHPGRDVCTGVLLTTWSCADHLAATALVLRDRQALSSPYTLTRGAAECAAAACYLSVQGITPIERIRRYMNRDLEALYEEGRLIGGFGSPEAKARVARNTERTAAIRRAAGRHGFTFTKENPYRAPFIGGKPPGAVALIDKTASVTEGLGTTYHRLLSGVSHGQTHGLARFLMPVALPAEPGQVHVQINVSAPVLAMHLLAGPLCASTLVGHLRWWLGWDTADISPLIMTMIQTWARVAGVSCAFMPAAG